jgi:hypothetical protein
MPYVRRSNGGAYGVDCQGMDGAHMVGTAGLSLRGEVNNGPCPQTESTLAVKGKAIIKLN